MPLPGRRATTFTSETARAAGAKGGRKSRRPKNSETKSAKLMREALAKVEGGTLLPDLGEEVAQIDALELANKYGAAVMARVIELALSAKDSTSVLAAARMVMQFSETHAQLREPEDISDLKAQIEELRRLVQKRSKKAEVVGLPTRTDRPQETG